MCGNCAISLKSCTSQKLDSFLEAPLSKNIHFSGIQERDPLASLLAPDSWMVQQAMVASGQREPLVYCGGKGKCALFVSSISALQILERNSRCQPDYHHWNSTLAQLMYFKSCNWKMGCGIEIVQSELYQGIRSRSQLKLNLLYIHLCSHSVLDQ